MDEYGRNLSDNFGIRPISLGTWKCNDKTLKFETVLPIDLRNE